MNTNLAVRAILNVTLLVLCIGCNSAIRPSPAPVPPDLPAVTFTPQQLSFTRPPQTAETVAQIVSPQAIKDFLVAKIGVSSCGGKVFAAYQIMGTEQTDQALKIYLWAMVQEYCVSQGGLAAGTGTSEPVVIFVKEQSGTYQIVAYKDAGEGYQYLKDNFPPSIWPLIYLPGDEYNQRTASLSCETKKEAEAYYGIPK